MPLAALVATRRTFVVVDSAPMDAFSNLESLGLTLPGPGYLFGSIVFGLIGLAAFRDGRRNARPRSKWIGVALMLYPYAVDQTWLLYLVGAALCAAYWWDRRQAA